MCLICGRLWTALQLLWSTLYVICGAAQLMSGIFFTISVPEIHLYNILVAGSWNIIIGISAGMVACLWALSPKRQETLLYLAVSILTVACVNLILTEYWFYKTDMPKLYKNYASHMLIDYACFVTRISTAVVLFVSFLDSQFAFCSMQVAPRNKRNKLKGSHEHVADIEYIIPRPKNSKPPATHTVYDAYARSWVFDAAAAEGHAGVSSVATRGEAPYFEAPRNGTPEKASGRGRQRDGQNVMVTENGHLIDNPVVLVEEASDDSGSTGDRQLCHMRSFSRSQSPVPLSPSSSQSSLQLNPNLNPNINRTTTPQPPIYECLEKLTEPAIYRSRLNTALSSKGEEEEEEEGVMRRVEGTSPRVSRVEGVSPRVEGASPRVEKVQYASLMKELQRAIGHKKEPPSVTSPQSSESTSEKNLSDADFSKELEAALQLIQDLESPNTIETPSDDPKSAPLAARRPSDLSDRTLSERTLSANTLSASGSLIEIAEQKPPANGKGADSQSTSGYSSPTHAPTPDWSTTSSINGGSQPDVKSYYSIRNTQFATVISLYSQPRSVTLVKITPTEKKIPHIHNSTFADHVTAKPVDLEGQAELSFEKTVLADHVTCTPAAPKEKPLPFGKDRVDSTVVDHVTVGKGTLQSGWKLNSLLRKKRQVGLPKMAPELEGAIVKSESLAYLTDLELLARHQRNKELQREIEKRVVQQLGAPRSTRTESNC